MLQQHLMGIPLKLIVENLEKEFEATAKNLYHDWERRRQWIPQVVQLDDPTLLHGFVEGPALSCLKLGFSFRTRRMTS